MPPSVPSRPCANLPPNPPQCIVPRNPRRYREHPYPLPAMGALQCIPSRDRIVSTGRVECIQHLRLTKSHRLGTYLCRACRE
jgi:hypothetical protein